MSAYAHQMERAFSAQSFSSSGGSEMESRYVLESGFYMTSFAATIFIGALVTIGVLLVTLLISLSVMLQSCESSNKGVVEISRMSEDYNYCKIFALHSELNSLEPDDFPSVCWSLSMQYIRNGQYERDLNMSLEVVERHFNSVTPPGDGLDVVLMDVDDILPPNPHRLHHRLDWHGSSDCFEEAKRLKKMAFLRLFLKLQASGWSLIFLSRKPEKQRNATIEHLVSAGYGGWSSLVMRSGDEMEIHSRDFISRHKTKMNKAGFRITAIVSCQMDAVTGPLLGELVFKLPNPMYYHMKSEKFHFPE